MKTPDREVPAHEIVAALFDVITEEAKRNETFARRLMSVYPKTIIARTTTTKKASKGFDAGDYHAVNILRNHGAALLRGRLSSLRTKAELREIAKRSGLKLTGKALGKNAGMSDIVDGIVSAAEQYVGQRDAAKK